MRVVSVTRQQGTHAKEGGWEEPATGSGRYEGVAAEEEEEEEDVGVVGSGVGAASAATGSAAADGR